MEPPSIPSHPAAAVAAAAAATAVTTVTTIPAPATVLTAPITTALPLYAESTNSSPRSRNLDSWDELLPPVQSAKLRLMCSYGGHIIPRPHDKSLCYVGGETRIVVVDRFTSLADLAVRLSRTLLNGREFTLKYQLPTEDLDSLISVSTDEDLENMVDEYDRTASSLKPSRLRLFLFPAKPESAASMGALLGDAKSETWFVDALNSVVSLPTRLSDSPAVDCLLSLDGGVSNDSCNDIEAQIDCAAEGKQGKQGHDVHSMPGSPLVETSSSFGSTSSSPSMSNLPPIRVRVDDGFVKMQEQKVVGIDDQFLQLNIAPAIQKQDASAMAVNPNLQQASVPFGDGSSRVFSDDGRSEQGNRKPPLPTQQVQRKSNEVVNLPSPDSVASDGGGVISVLPFPEATLHPDLFFQRENRGPMVSMDPKLATVPESSATSPFAAPQFHDPVVGGYMFPDQQQQIRSHQQQQQQPSYIHTSARYIPHPGGAGAISYYPVYAPSLQQQPQQQAPLHQGLDHQYPFYLLPLPHSSQPYNYSVQSSHPDISAMPPTRQPSPQLPSLNHTPLPPPYTVNPRVAGYAPDMGAYKVGSSSQPQQVAAAALFPHQNVAFSPAVAPTTVAAAASQQQQQGYGYQYGSPGGPPHPEQLYYAAHPGVGPQYQTMSPAAAMMLATETSVQAVQEEKQQQRVVVQPGGV